MSDEPNEPDPDQAETNRSIDPRPGSAIEAAKRASKVAPPPLPNPSSPVPATATPPTLTIVDQASLGNLPNEDAANDDRGPSDQPELVLAEPVADAPGAATTNDDEPDVDPALPRRTRRPRSAAPRAPKDAPKLLGRPLGNIRQVLVNLRIETRELLDARVAANGTALGVEAMAAVRATHKEFRAEAPEPEDDNDFAPPRQFVRQMPKGEKRSTTISVSNEEAAALSDLSAATRMSVAYLIDEAIRRHWGE